MLEILSMKEIGIMESLVVSELFIIKMVQFNIEEL